MIYSDSFRPGGTLILTQNLHNFANQRLFSSSIKTQRNQKNNEHFATDQSWSEEWKSLGLGARLPHSPDTRITNLLFVQTGFGIDQHGNRTVDGATKAAVRAVRNAIEFNSIPGVIEAVPGGRNEMLIKVLLGVPLKLQRRSSSTAKGSDVTPQNKKSMVMELMDIDLSHVAKVFPYGRLLPIDVTVGGLSFPTGRIVSELGDDDDSAICVVASISIGYDSGERQEETTDGRTGSSTHITYSTLDGH